MQSPQYCPNCGELAAPPYRFCPGCGQALAPTGLPPVADTPIWQYSGPNLTVEVYQNRVEIGRGAALTRREVIPARQIASVEKTLTSCVIRTVDGREHKLGLGYKADAARKAILSIL